MSQKGTTQAGAFSYEVIDERIAETRIYQLVRFSLSKTNATTRRRIMKEILEKSSVIGLIEWWKKGSIIHKPKWQFYCILVLKRSSGA